MKAKIISVRNVNEALSDGLHWLAVAGIEQPSRNGTVLRAPGPVITEYSHPMERVMFSALRDANPFFHLYECIWMLAGRNDSAAVANYAKHMDSFAENGVMNGAYGHRWRSHFGYDQLKFVVEELQGDAFSRRVVLSMWDPGHPPDMYKDLEGDPHKARAGSKDVPCNTHVYFEIVNGYLNMTVCNRSNDVVWGAYGANVVHMSFLQEVLAAALSVRVGTYWQISNNFHVYTEREDVKRLIENTGMHWNVKYAPDERAPVLPHPVNQAYFKLEHFLYECECGAEYPNTFNYGYVFLRDVFKPMMSAHALHKAGHTESALLAMKMVAAEDWRIAGTEWLERRLKKQQEKANGAV